MACSLTGGPTINTSHFSATGLPSKAPHFPLTTWNLTYVDLSDTVNIVLKVPSTSSCYQPGMDKSERAMV